MAILTRVTGVANASHARHSLVTAAFPAAWAVLAVVMLLVAVGPAIPLTVRYGVLLATLLVVGLPHGAFDHLTVPRARRESLSLRWLLRFSVGYLALAGAYAVGWLVAPTLSFVGFILLTWYHWGQGERYPLRSLLGGRHLGTPLVRWGTVLTRGGIPMVVPLVCFPERYRSVALTVVSLFDGTAGGWLTPLFATETRFAVGVGLAAVTVGTLVAGYATSDDRGPWLVDAGETALLWMHFAVVPPVLAIGVYFAVWHSLRHLVRLVALDAAAVEDLDQDHVGRAIWRVTRDATPMTVGALGVFAAIWVAVPNAPGSIEAVGGVYLVVLAVLTLPHVVVVTWLDHRQGV